MQGRLTLQRRDSQTAVQDDLTYEYNTGTTRLRNTDPNDGENWVQNLFYQFQKQQSIILC